MSNTVALIAELRAVRNRYDFAQIYLRHLCLRAADEMERIFRGLGEVSSAYVLQRIVGVLPRPDAPIAWVRNHLTSDPQFMAGAQCPGPDWVALYAAEKEPVSELCPNCDGLLPEGCGGRFKKYDGDDCRHGKQPDEMADHRSDCECDSCLTKHLREDALGKNVK